MTRNIESIRNQDLADETERREKRGSNILSQLAGLSFKTWQGSIDHRARLRRGSKGWLELRYGWSDKQIVGELVRRLSDGDGDLLQLLKIVQNKQVIRCLDRAIKRCGGKQT
jgi:hypothetical protein